MSLFVFIGLCWLPVVLIQYQCQRLAQTCNPQQAIPELLQRLMACWFALGVPAFAALMIIFWLMILNPYPFLLDCVFAALDMEQSKASCMAMKRH